MSTYILEEFILQNIVLVIFGIGLVIACINEYIQRKQELDEISQLKLKKIFKFAYNVFWNGNKEETKQKTISFCKEVKKRNLINEKYDLIKGA
jgi:hypothetical protein